MYESEHDVSEHDVSEHSVELAELLDERVTALRATADGLADMADALVDPVCETFGVLAKRRVADLERMARAFEMAPLVRRDERRLVAA